MTSSSPPADDPCIEDLGIEAPGIEAPGIDVAVRRGPGAFFGRRKGPKLRDHQAALIADLLPRLSIEPATPAPADTAALFATPVDALMLEIGFGGGEHLIAEAQANPRTGFIGCEPYINGMAKILAQLERAPRANLRLFAGDAAMLLAWLKPQSVDRIDLIHPDPWPKRRHWKRRFVQHATLDAMARVLRPGGLFRFVTDIDDYAAWTLAHVQPRRDFSWTAERADDWRTPFPGHVMTRYGEKAAREGRRAVYLAFERQAVT